MKSPEGTPKIETQQETMKPPEVEIREEKGPMLLSLLLKGHRPEREESEPENEVTKKVVDFFEKNPLDGDSKEFLEEIGALEDRGVDEETLYNMSLTHGRPERIDDLFDFIKKHKNEVADPRKVRVGLIKELNKLEKALPKSLKKTIEEATLKDIESRKENIDYTKKRIEDVTDFFKPKTATSKIDKVTVMPTDFLFPKESGKAFRLGNEVILQSQIENPKGLDYEFLHPVINPIIEKLSSKLTEEQKEKIVKMGSHNLKVEQKYGNDYFRLLCEEFIRTYNELIQDVKTPVTIEDFEKEINEMDEVGFAEILSQKENLKNRFKKLDISTLKDLKSKSRKFYNEFEKNDLREIVFLFYQKYIHEREENEKVTFEDFVLEKFNEEI